MHDLFLFLHFLKTFYAPLYFDRQNATLVPPAIISTLDLDALPDKVD